MKKIATILTALALVLSFAACGKTDKKPDSTSDASQTENTTVTTEPTTDTSAPETDAASDPKALLDAIWNNYKEDDKFPAAGGDYDEVNMVDGAPGNVGLADADSVEHLTGFPAASIGEIDAAASLFHMMNGNSFTCGAYRVKEGTDVDALAQSIRDAIQGRRWMCGFPDKIVIATVDNYIVSVFGLEDLVDNFRDTMLAVYPATSVVFDEPIE
ncbi:MAG: bacteriocin transport accessory protein [Clostridiales bacterium]|nr:bacteriocin transport accessory protein [Clostridiales bacterium]